ncbi:MAG TPA: hypothetical protein ENF92_08210 [Desulfobacteraceae bacterium]|nr:hypothetical protein [Deltaproteobacteria bacterium]HDM10482.1 hypothetical protein [Desulfobacteraceae bacterium]
MELNRKGCSLGTIVTLIGMLALIWACFSLPSLASEKKNLPERLVRVYPEYTGVVIDEGEGVSIDLFVKNGGKKDETVDLKVIEVPKGWKAWIKTYSYGVTGVHVGSDESRSLTFRAEPGKNVGPGKYVFKVVGETTDHKFKSTHVITINVKAKEKGKKSKGVNITASYPVLRGPTDAKFEFSIEVENKLDKDAVFSLTAKAPENWDVNFKPAYEDKFISSVRLKADQSQSVAVEVKPFPLAEPGKYPIAVKVSSPEAEGEVKLSIILTGTYKMEVGTSDGLLSLNAQKGKPSSISVYVKNTGSAPLNNIHFLSFKPENWKVAFKPEKIETLAPDALKQIEVTVKPSDQALVGDYSVSLNIDAGKVRKNLELRVTVKASTAWGWIGIGIIVFVLLGLVILFVKLGRR